MLALVVRMITSHCNGHEVLPKNVQEVRGHTSRDYGCCSYVRTKHVHAARTQACTHIRTHAQTLAHMCACTHAYRHG